MEFLQLPTVKEFSSLSLRIKLACLYFLVMIPFCILGVEHVTLLQELLAREKSAISGVLTGSETSAMALIQTLERDLLQTEFLIAIVFLSLSLVMFIMVKTARAQSAQLQNTLVHFTHGQYQHRLTSRHLADLEDIAGEINVMGVRQSRLHQKVSDAMIEVISASEQMTKVIARSATGSAEQIQDVSRVAAAIEEITNSMASAAHNAMETNRISDESAGLAREGELKVRQMHEEMLSINTIVDGTNKTIQTLESRSQEVSYIVHVIQGIAEQTNLLALNAAVEAARAGDQGRGFAVVADEVRNLATKTTGATAEISELITKMQTEVTRIVENIGAVHASVETGVERSSEAEHSLLVINQRSQETRDMIAEISASLVQQQQAASEISSSMHRVSEMAEVNKHSVDETRSASTYLEQLSKNLLRDIGS